MVQVPVLLLALQVCACASPAVGLRLPLVAGGQAEVEIAQVGWGLSALLGPAQLARANPAEPQ